MSFFPKSQEHVYQNAMPPCHTPVLHGMLAMSYPSSAGDAAPEPAEPAEPSEPSGMSTPPVMKHGWKILCKWDFELKKYLLKWWMFHCHRCDYWSVCMIGKDGGATFSDSNKDLEFAVQGNCRNHQKTQHHRLAKAKLKRYVDSKMEKELYACMSG